MATNTNGGTTSSFMNTPQAKDDLYSVYEDNIWTFDVMANDLGGNAKILWSIDDSNLDGTFGVTASGDGTYDLLKQDAALVPELSDLGARIWIDSGKIKYDASLFNYLGAGQSVTDHFTYAIRMSNGTLSWATVTVTISGTNDGPDIRVGSGDTGSAGLNETNAGLYKTGTLTVTDPDTSDTISTSIALTGTTGPLGGLTNAQLQSMFSVTPASGLAANVGDANNLTWKFDSGSQAFNYLRAGQTLQLVYTLTVNDGALTDAQTVTITITGTNDAPVLSDTTDPSAVLEAGDASAQNLSPITGNFSVTDLDNGDTLDASVVGDATVLLNGNPFVLPVGASALTAVGAFTVTDTVSNGGAVNIGYSYDPGAANLDFLGAGESLTITYTVQVNDGTTNSGTQNVTFTITGSNDAPVVTGDLSAPIGEGGTYQLTTADVNFTDPDDGASEVTFTVSGLSNGTLYVNGIAATSFTGQQLADGLVTFTHNGSETLTAGFNISVEDGNEDSSAPVAQPFNFTVSPVNDAPVNTVPGGQSVNEDQTLVFNTGNGNAISISDVDAGSNTVQVTLSVASGTLTLGSLVGLTVTAGANGSSTVTVQGTQAAINSGLQGLTYQGNLNFNGGDSLSIVTSDLGNSGSGGTLTDTDSVVITVNAVDDAPVNNMPASFSTNEDTALTLSGLSVTDVDAGAGSISVTLGVGSGTLAAVTGGGVSVSGSGTGSIVLSGTLAAINAYLASGAAPVFTPVANANGPVTLTMTTNDNGFTGAGGPLSDTDNRTITVNAVNDPPTVTNLSISATTISFTATDPDNPTLSLVAPFAAAFGNPTITSGATTNLTPTAQASPLSGTLQVTDGTSPSAVVGLILGTSAGSGADTLTAAGSTPTAIYGFDGIDTITGGTGADWLFGGNGNDIINGEQNDILIDGGANNDTLRVGALFTSTSDAQIANIETVLMTTAGTLNLSNQTEAFTITGSSGSDTITGGSGADSISAGAGNDFINGAQNDALLDGGANTDTLITNANFTSTSDAQIANIESISIQAAGTTLNLANQTEAFSISGSAGIDNITGGTAADSISANAGNDTIVGAQNDTLLDGGADTDTLQVGANFTSASDAQIANIENVTLTAAVTLNLANQTEAFNITGSSGADTITGGSGADSISAGGGDDTIVGAQNDALIDGGASTAGTNGDRLQVGANFTSTSDGQIVNVETVTLTAASTLNLSNQSEAFIINGSSGVDTIVGGSGADIINGQGGNDTLTGNGGVDQFRLNTLSGTDTVTDLAVATDKIGFAGTGATGGVSFTTAGTATGAALGAADFVTRAGVTSLANTDDQKVVVITSTQTTTQITNGTAGGASDDYVVVFNSTTGKAEIWFDDNWANINNRVQVATLDGVTAGQVAAMTASNFVVYNNTLGPAGAAGSAIDLNLENAANLTVGVAATISGVPQGWSLSSGVDNGDGTWTVDYDQLRDLTIVSPAGSASAALLTVSQTWTNDDGSTGFAIVEDNVVAYAGGTPIYAWAGDDTLTGSADADTFVFSQPIGADTIRNFDASADRIDLIGYGVSDYSGLSISDSNGGAVIDLGNGQTILLDGVSMSSLTAANFEFNVSPTIVNAGTMTVGNGAVLPLSGTIDNSGTISLESAGATTVLQLIQYGITLQGGGSLILSDSASNVVSGTLPTVTFTNVDNVISGAGQLGGGSLTLINGGTIVADGGNALVIDTGANAVTNSGTIEATGLGGLEIVGSIANSGTLLVDGSSILIGGNLSGGGDVMLNGVSSVEFGAGASNDVMIDAGASGLIVFDDADGFSGSISGLDFNDQIDLRDVVFDAGTSMSFTDSGNGSGVLTITDATHSVQLVLVGDYRIEDFILASNGQGGSLLTNNVGDLLFP